MGTEKMDTWTNRMAPLLQTPQAEKLFEHFGQPIPLFKPPEGFLDLFRRPAKPPNIDIYLQHMTASFGITGSGKSNSMGRSVEEMMLKRVKCLVVDYKGENTGLNQHPDLDHVKFKVVNLDGDAAEAAHKYLEEDYTVDLNLKGLKMEQYLPYLDTFFMTLWELRRQEAGRVEKDGSVLVPNKIFIEEADKFIPRQLAGGLSATLRQSARSLVSSIRNYAQQGRSYGQSLEVISQRPSAVDTSIRNQADVFRLFKQSWKNDIEIYMKLVPNATERNQRAQIEGAIRELAPGSCIFVAFGSAEFVQHKKKRSKDLSTTPGFAQIESFRGA